jgi:hypothetical protein
VLKLYVKLNQSGVLELQTDLQENADMTTVVAAYFLRNPDVVLREEDEDGGLLFNPDTNQIRVLNNTGLFIWKMCDGTSDFPDFLAAIRESYEEVPEEQTDIQIKGFIDDMVASGFIGIQPSKKIKNPDI